MTIKSKTDLGTELTTNLANNTSGDISPADARGAMQNILDSVHGVYGNMSVTGGSTPQSLTDVPAALTSFDTDGLENGTTVDSTTDNDIVVGTAGVYLCIAVLEGTGVASKTYTAGIALEGTRDDSTVCAYLTTGTETFTLTCVGLITCAAGEALTVSGDSGEAGGNNLTLINASFTVYRIA